MQLFSRIVMGVPTRPTRCSVVQIADNTMPPSTEPMMTARHVSWRMLSPRPRRRARAAELSASGAAKTTMALCLVEADDLHPVRALARRILADLPERATRRIDCVRRDGVR